MLPEIPPRPSYGAGDLEKPSLQALTRALEIVERLLEEGRSEEALEVVRAVKGTLVSS